MPLSCWSYPDAKIVVVDDYLENANLAYELLTFVGYHNVIIITEPADALKAIESIEPDLVLLDLNMPDVTGYDILEHLHEDSLGDDFVPVVAFTADNTPYARERALKLGASDFITKPFDSTELLLRVRNFLRMRFLHLALRDQNLALEMQVKKRTHRLEQARIEAIQCLGRAAEFRDDTTGAHTRRVGELSGQIAIAMGLPNTRVDLIRQAAPLHDLGKIAIPDGILLKEGPLSEGEFEVMKTHTMAASNIIGQCRSPVLRLARKIAQTHHERWDGSGYPAKLSGEAIPIESRIVAVADMYDALTHKRPYKDAWNPKDAIKEIVGQKGCAFDPAVIDAFLDVISRYPEPPPRKID